VAPKIFGDSVAHSHSGRFEIKIKKNSKYKEVHKRENREILAT